MNITVEDENILTAEKIADALKDRNNYDTCAFNHETGVFTATKGTNTFEIDQGGWIRKVDANGETAVEAEEDSANIEDQIGAQSLVWARDMDGKLVAVVHW